MLAIARDTMQRKATKKDCKQPYSEYLTDEEQESRNESVVGSFFKRIKAQNG